MLRFIRWQCADKRRKRIYLHTQIYIFLRKCPSDRAFHGGFLFEVANKSLLLHGCSTFDYLFRLSEGRFSMRRRAFATKKEDRPTKVVGGDSKVLYQT